MTGNLNNDSRRIQRKRAIAALLRNGEREAGTDSIGTGPKVVQVLRRVFFRREQWYHLLPAR
jgi:hypothetical protein